MASIKIGCYIGSWPQNIGNAFFDLGSRAILQLAFPDAEFYNLGGAVHWMFNASELHHKHFFVGKTGGKILRKLGVITPCDNNNSFEVGQAAEVDVLVFAGMSMCREFVENNGRTFFDAARRGVAVLGLGAGGALYNNDEVRSFSDFFAKLPKAAIITRDDDTYDMFSNSIHNIERGIDCAFCLPEYYTPPHLNLPTYDIVNFDSGILPPIIDHVGHEIFYTHHDCWGILPKKYLSKPNTLVSDVPEDYLTLYSQVHTTYSDRVHACVASLAYGNRAQLFSKTPRKALFKRMGVEKITSSVVELNQNLREDFISKQIELTRETITNLLS